MAKRRRKNQPKRNREKEPASILRIDPLVRKAERLAADVANELESVLAVLSAERVKRPPYPRDRADVEIAATRLGRMLQLLQGAQLLAKHHLGTAVAPVVRAMWDTWFDTAWMLRDPSTRMERATAFWTAGMAQQLGIIRAFETRDGFLVPSLQEAKDELEVLVKAEPHLYNRWLDDQAQPKCSLHSIRWTDVNTRARAERMGSMYERAYDIDYTLLSIAAHGEGMELPRLMSEREDGATMIEVGEGRDASVDRFVQACGIALTLVYEIQHTYLGGHTKVVDEIRARCEALRKESPTLI